MSVQTSITEFFNSRKRTATDDCKVGQPNKKVMILEKIDGDVSECPKFNSNVEQHFAAVQARRKLIYVDRKLQCPVKSGIKVLNKKVATNKQNSKKVAFSSKIDIRNTFAVLNKSSGFVSNEKTSDLVTEESKNLPSTSTQENNETSSLMDKDVSKHNNSEITTTEQNIKQNSTISSEKNPKPDKLEPKKELNLNEIASKLKQNSRYGDFKARLDKLRDGISTFEKRREKRIEFENSTLKKVDTVCIEVPSSPVKTPVKISNVMSPAKLREAVFKSPGRSVNMEPVYVSPRKLFEMYPDTNSPTKAPAFQRFQALVSEGRSALQLPFKYRSLAEMFRGVETVVSMLHNRGETVRFPRLKLAVQELLRRNLYEKHLAQMKAVYEEAYEIVYEKLPSCGKFQIEKYDLVIKPILQNSNNNVSEVTKSQETKVKIEMSPDVLLERRRIFFQRLLEKTKVYHEEFLLNLDPPINVSRDLITRWHPEFDVDDVPDVEPAFLPDPPNVQKSATAKDVLERARNLFGSNHRLETAMQSVKQANNETVSNTPPATSSSGPAVAAFTNALKGIPKSLLEKVRAKQAAKALEVMTRSPSQAKEAVRLTRLPEIARIVRNIFILEKKSVLAREMVIKKLLDSYRENLSFFELNDHLNLLQEKTPDWLTFCTLRKTNYVKFVKDADMVRIMTHLESLASDNAY